MTKYHVNEAGEAGACHAQKGKCPFGGEANHYSSKADARKAYELSMAAKNASAPLKKKKKPRISSAEAIQRAAVRRSHRDFLKIIDEIGPIGAATNTHQTLMNLVENDDEGGSMFARASRLKKKYENLRKEGKALSPSIEANDIPRDGYLHMVAPATTAAVMQIESSLEDKKWTARIEEEDIDRNIRDFSKLLTLDMSQPDSVRKASEELKNSGWDLDDEEETYEELSEAIIEGQKKALTYGNQFVLEQTRML